MLRDHCTCEVVAVGMSSLMYELESFASFRKREVAAGAELVLHACTSMMLTYWPHKESSTASAPPAPAKAQRPLPA